MRLLIAILFSLCASVPAMAQTVVVPTTQNKGLNGTGGARITHVSCTAAPVARWTGWVRVDTQARAVFAVDYVDTAGTTTAIRVDCRASDSVTVYGAPGSAYSLPVDTATSAAGITTMMAGKWDYSPNVAGPLGTVYFVHTVAGIPMAFLGCTFTCVGGGAADILSVSVKGVTP